MTFRPTPPIPTVPTDRASRIVYALVVLAGAVFLSLSIRCMWPIIIGVLGAAWVIGWSIVITHLKSAPRFPAHTCQECGYDRRGLDRIAKCPECGHLPRA